MLIEATAATWLLGTAFEHNTLYRYNLNSAKNVYIGMQQSETPYWQGTGSSSLAPSPWTAAGSDPTFSNCGSSDAQVIIPSPIQLATDHTPCSNAHIISAAWHSSKPSPALPTSISMAQASGLSSTTIAALVEVTVRPTQRKSRPLAVCIIMG